MNKIEKIMRTVKKSEYSYKQLLKDLKKNFTKKEKNQWIVDSYIKKGYTLTFPDNTKYKVTEVQKIRKDKNLITIKKL